MYNEIGVRTNMLRSIEFRSKFVKQIQNLPEETQEGLKKVAIRFVNDENDDKCLDILWRMTYDPETAINMLGIRFRMFLQKTSETNFEPKERRFIPNSWKSIFLMVAKNHSKAS